MKRKTKKWFKRHIYSMSIICLIFIIIVSVCIIFREDITKAFDHVSTDIVAQVKEKQKMTEKKARKMAVEKFKELGEQNIQESDLNVNEIERNGEKYYFIASKDNTLEIMISTGEIKRINSIVVE